MLDFVPNHMGLDHPWVEDHPDYFIQGTELDLARAPQNYTWVKRKRGDLLLAYGRDPYFSGWPDTLQLNYANPATQEAMIGELVKIAGQCDGVRCDMAMLVLPDVFERTWGQRAPLFWPTATQRVRERVPGFLFMAEVYWDLEWTLQQQGFDYAYDKRLYDRLRERPCPAGARAFPRGPRLPGQAGPLPGEPRRAAGGGDVLSGKFIEAAAVITFLVARPAFLPPGTVRGPKETDLAPSRAAARTNPSIQNAEAVLRPPACRAAPAGRSRWPVAIARMRSRLGRQLDERLLPGFRLARPGWRAAAGRRELCAQPEPMPRPVAVRGPRRQEMASAGSNRHGYP